MQNPLPHPPPPENQPCLGLLHPPPCSQTSKSLQTLTLKPQREKWHKGSPQTQAPPGEPRIRRNGGAQRSHEAVGAEGCRCRSCTRLACGRDGLERQVFPRLRRTRGCVHGRTRATTTFARSKIPQSVDVARMSQVGSSSPGAQHGKRKRADPRQGAGQLGRRGPLLPAPRAPVPAHNFLCPRAAGRARGGHTRAIYRSAASAVPGFQLNSQARGKGGEGVQ